MKPTAKFDVVQVAMKSEKVSIICTALPKTKALVMADRMEQKTRNQNVFHDFVPTGAYQNGDNYEGNRR